MVVKKQQYEASDGALLGNLSSSPQFASNNPDMIHNLYKKYINNNVATWVDCNSCDSEISIAYQYTKVSEFYNSNKDKFTL